MNADGLKIVVLSYGDGGEAGRLVEQLVGAEGIEPRRILVVHNPARPGEGPPPLPEDCELIVAERNRGYAGGMNLGLEAALAGEEELLLLLTHDARLLPGSLERLLAAARASPVYGLLGPALVEVDSGEPFSFGAITRANGSNAHLRERPPAPPDGIFRCDWIDGGTMLVRAQLLRRIGGFDTGFFAYFEEADLCLRARRAGAAVGVVLEALAEQDPGGLKRPGAWAYLNTRNGIAFARRAAGARGLAWLTTRSLWNAAILLCRVLARTLRSRPGGTAEPWAMAVGTVRGVVDFYRGVSGPPPAGLPGMGDVGNA